MWIYDDGSFDKKFRAQYDVLVENGLDMTFEEFKESISTMVKKSADFFTRRDIIILSLDPDTEEE